MPDQMDESSPQVDRRKKSSATSLVSVPPTKCTNVAEAEKCARGIGKMLFYKEEDERIDRSLSV